MFTLHRPPFKPHEVYSDSLKPLGPGWHAIWYPEPHASGEPQIGDVGFMRDGAFIRLFNIQPNRPHEQIATYWDPPFAVTEELQVLPANAFKTDSRREPLKAPGRYASDGVQQKSGHMSVNM